MDRSKRFCTAAAVALLACAPCLGTASAEPRSPHESVTRIQVAGTTATMDGACVLVAIEQRPGEAVQYFLTAAHLFSSALLGTHATAALQITLTLPNGTTLRTSGSHVLFPSGMESGVDVAVVRLAAAPAALAPEPVAFDAPEVGEPFTIRGPADLLRRESAERVRFKSTRLIVGDRALLDVSSMVGAPAFGDKGVFGLTSTTGANGIPIVTLLAGAREFLKRALPSSAVHESIVRPTTTRPGR